MSNQRKVAVMTWYTYRNYGSALQASALCEALRALGYDPTMINYTPKGDAVVKQKVSLSSYAKKVVKRLKRGGRSYVSPEREALFASFLDKRLKETAPCNTYPELHMLNNEFDAFVCGSDQIWAPVCFDEAYFLSFADRPEKRVAYAPSIGLPRVDHPVIRERMTKFIGEVGHLSVRETQGAALIKELTGRDAEVVLDPTLLLGAKQWDDYAETAESKTIDGDYIVCYFLGDAARYADHVKRLSEKTGLPAYLIPVTRDDVGIPSVPFEVGPREFVSLVRGAKHVCTDSFHGMAFSINYHVPFTVFKRFADNDPRNQNSRILSLLSLLGLEDRLVDPSADCRDTAVTFDAVEQTLDTLRRSSLIYLRDALAAATAEHEPLDTFTITERCCGCGACAAVCGTGAVVVEQNDEGFQHYRIDESKCVKCGRCQAVCPFGTVIAPSLRDMQALYSAKSADKAVLRRSSSGGIGFEIAKFAAKNGAHVCGCAYDRKTDRAEHRLLPPDGDMAVFSGSKYIQSVSAQALNDIRHLPKGTELVFFGTPCQTAGVDKLLTATKRRDSAILVDLICHGVPSAHLWTAFLNEVDERYEVGAHPTVEFRSKEQAWRKLQMTVTGNGNAYKKLEQVDDFYGFFRRGLCYMESCFDCPYRERSGADIRIGDYWGPRFENDTEGVSMVLACTENGQRFLEALKKDGAISLTEQAKEEYWAVQYPYNHPKPLFREELIGELKSGKRPLSELRRDYCAPYDTREKIAKTVRLAKRLLRRGK